MNAGVVVQIASAADPGEDPRELGVERSASR